MSPQGSAKDFSSKAYERGSKTNKDTIKDSST